MNQNKEQIIDMHIERIVRTMIYIDILYRMLNEFIQNPNDNLKRYDIPNLAQLLLKYVYRLKLCILNMQTDWEFYDSKYKYRKNFILEN